MESIMMSKDMMKITLELNLMKNSHSKTNKNQTKKNAEIINKMLFLRINTKLKINFCHKSNKCRKIELFKNKINRNRRNYIKQTKILKQLLIIKLYINSNSTN